jgi:hypothetical protein
MPDRIDVGFSEQPHLRGEAGLAGPPGHLAHGHEEASRVQSDLWLDGVCDPHAALPCRDRIKDMGPLGTGQSIAEAHLLAKIGDVGIGVEDEAVLSSRWDSACIRTPAPSPRTA